MREELVDILPKCQSELPARRMIDSYDSAIIPIGSDPTLRDRYLTHHGGVRIGRLLEDMDIFAVHLGRASHLITRIHEIVFSFQTCDEHSPKRRHGQPLLYCHRSGGSNWLHRENAVGLWYQDLRLVGETGRVLQLLCSGHVTWAGSSSMECTLMLEQLVEEDWVKFTEARFLIVARDPVNSFHQSSTGGNKGRAGTIWKRKHQ